MEQKKFCKYFIRGVMPKEWSYEKVVEYCNKVNDILFQIDANYVFIPIPPEGAVEEFGCNYEVQIL